MAMRSDDFSERRVLAVTPEQRTAGRTVAFLVHVVAFACTCALIALTAGPMVALIVALGWGIGLAAHGLAALVLPRMRASAPAAEPITRGRAAAAPDPRTDTRPHEPGESRTRALEELSAAIAHEIRNPITAAKSLAQQIAEDPGGGETAEHARVVVAELDRVERSIAHLLRFAREEPFEPVPTDVAALIESALELMRDRADRAGVRLERDVEPLPSAEVDGEQLRKVLANLIGNALEAHAQSPGPGAFVRVTAGQNLAGDELWIRVRDNGPGIPEAVRRKLFRPFQSSKPNGNGLGLPLARKVLERHGGSIELVEHPGPGAELLLTFPRALAKGRRP